MKKVPEKDQVASKEDAAVALLEKLAGNQSFKRQRGELGDAVIDIILNLIELADSPTGFLRDFDRWTSDVRVLANQLAIYRRDGVVTAENDLVQALRSGLHTIHLETIPAEKTVPATVIILDFPRTLTMIEWIRFGAHHQLVNAIVGRDVSQLTQDLYAQYPTLPKHVSDRLHRNPYIGDDLRNAYFDTVRQDLDNVLFKKLHSKLQSLAIAHRTYDSKLEVGDDYHGTFGYLCVGLSQVAVLSKLPREVQDRIATWNLTMPATVAETDRFAIGFCSEDDHKAWRAHSGYFPSSNCNGGYGAILLPRNPTAFCKKYDPKSGYNDTHDPHFAFALENGSIWG